jgi:hypothetical protein
MPNEGNPVTSSPNERPSPGGDLSVFAHASLWQQGQASPPARPAQPRANVEATTPPATQVPDARSLGDEIRRSVNQTIQQAIDQQRAAMDQARAGRDAARNAADAARAAAQAARQAGGFPGQDGPRFQIMEVPQRGRAPVVPQGAVDITVAFFVTCAIILIGYPIARAIARRIDRRTETMTTPPDVNARLERIEQAVDTIAIEMERVSEGQRFTSRILGELRGLPAPNPLDQARGTNREAIGLAVRSERSPDHR